MLLPNEQHFIQRDHDFTRDAQCITIEQIDQIFDDKLANVLEKHDDLWTKYFIPHGST